MMLDVPGREALGGKAGPVLALLCLSPFVAVLDTTIMSIALPSIRDDLAFAASDVQWVLTAYSLSFGGLLLLAGRVGDSRGRKRVLVAGYALFGLASLLGGLAPSPLWLVLARILQGVASAALVPSSLSLVTALYAEGRERNRALAAFGAMTGTGFVTAMLLGGGLTNWWGWRWILLINVPIALVAVVGAIPLIDESRDPDQGRPLDALGAVTATLAVGAVIYALSEAAELGWSSPRVVIFLVAGLGLVSLFVRHESKARDPLVPPSLLQRLEVSSAYLVAGWRSMFGIGVIFVLTLFLQDVRSLDPLQTGLLFTPMAVTSVLVAPLSGRLTTRLGVRTTVTTGLLTMLAGAALILQLPTTGTLTLVIVGMVVCETGFMLSEVPTTVAAAGALGDRHGGLAAGLLGTSQQLGHAVGLAAIGSVMAIVVGGVSPSAERVLVAGLRWAVLVAAAGAILALITTLRWLPARAPSDETS